MPRSCHRALSLKGTVNRILLLIFNLDGNPQDTSGLCFATELPYVTVLGTTMASMALPSFVSSATHYRMGNLRPAAVLPLCVGSAIGAFAGGQLAVHSPGEEYLQLLFALLIGGMGGQKLWALRGLR